jgi:hypothetical protein
MRRIIFSLVLLFVLQSCSSDDAQEATSNFYALTVGNSWEYRWYGKGIDVPLGPMSVEESVSIVDTEMIDNNIYFKFKRIVSGNDSHPDGHYLFSLPDGEYFEYYRDSLGYLINEEGIIKFSNSATEPFVFSVGSEDIIGTANVEDELLTYTTPVGDSFDCTQMIISYATASTNYLAKNRHYYANGIGLVKDDVIFMSSGATEEETSGHYRILESYSVQ